ncbi:MAG: hypothetical protein MNPFHGCM_03185 [Gemmatimonadaceae bacterium]|nr:hypothetical protein [Gemmatimonadaceae bacterium]
MRDADRPRVDVNAFVGAYPFRHVPHPDPATLVRVLDREGTDEAWVGHLPGVFHRDPGPGSRELFELLAPHAERLRAVPAVRPDWPDWCAQVDEYWNRGAVAIRAYPPQWGLGPSDDGMIELSAACAERRLPLVLTVKFEDLRQRHPLDVAGDLQPAAVRALARAGTGVDLLVTAAGREFIEEVHWGLTAGERRHVWWDISWIWGPPEEDLAHLVRTIGADRLAFGTMWPLRLTQVARANLALLPAELRAYRLGVPGVPKGA